MPAEPTTCRPEDERLPLAPTYAYGVQHILTMYGGVIALSGAPPVVVTKEQARALRRR